ncbi:MAG: hypothetical protein ACO1NO_04525 [Burkholderiaceae bacterium]
MIGAVAASAALCACTGFSPSGAGKETAESTGEQSRPVYLRAMKTQLSTPRADIGTRYEGTHCLPQGKIVWDDALFREISHRLPKIFRHDAQRAHYRVPPDAAEDLNAPAQPHYVEIDMQVQDAHADLCMQEEGSSGSAQLNVLWQVYSAGTSTPLYETTTQGSYQAPIMERRTTSEFFAFAFSAALNTLLTDPGFRHAVRQARP